MRWILCPACKKATILKIDRYVGGQGIVLCEHCLHSLPVSMGKLMTEEPMAVDDPIADTHVALTKLAEIGRRQGMTPTAAEWFVVTTLDH